VKQFLTDLRDLGRVKVPSSLHSLEADLDASTLEPLLREIHDKWALRELIKADPMPELDVWVMADAARLLYRLCQFVVCREADAACIQRAIEELPLPGETANDIYSVDVMLRYLPDLAKIAKRVAMGDPLNDALTELGKAWPLSSVGMPSVGAVQPEAMILDSPVLKALYVDRILATNDVRRVLKGPIYDAVKAAIGGFPQLAPKIARYVKATPASRLGR